MNLEELEKIDNFIEKVDILLDTVWHYVNINRINKIYKYVLIRK